MKKKNLNSLKLNKKSISNLDRSKGGAKELGTSYFSCIGGICASEFCETFLCHSLWVDALCTAFE